MKDIADVVTIEQDLFSPEDQAMLTQSHAITLKDNNDINLDDMQSDSMSRA